MEEQGSDWPLAVYLAGVTGIATASIAIFYILFTTGFPRFVSGFLDSPGHAVRTDPTSIVLAIAGTVLVVLLVSLVVVFGATYGLQEEGHHER